MSPDRRGFNLNSITGRNYGGYDQYIAALTEMEAWSKLTSQEQKEAISLCDETLENHLQLLEQGGIVTTSGSYFQIGIDEKPYRTLIERLAGAVEEEGPTVNLKEGFTVPADSIASARFTRRTLAALMSSHSDLFTGTDLTVLSYGTRRSHVHIVFPHCIDYLVRVKKLERPWHLMSEREWFLSGGFAEIPTKADDIYLNWQRELITASCNRGTAIAEEKQIPCLIHEKLITTGVEEYVDYLSRES